jgi:hypothetical protein
MTRASLFFLSSPNDMRCQWGRRCTDSDGGGLFPKWETLRLSGRLSRPRHALAFACFSSYDTDVQLRWDVRRFIFRRIFSPRELKRGSFLALCVDIRVVACETGRRPRERPHNHAGPGLVTATFNHHAAPVHPSVLTRRFLMIVWRRRQDTLIMVALRQKRFRKRFPAH